jgi:hypothetical protein
LEYINVSGVCTASIIRVIAQMMYAVHISETSVYSDTTERYIPEGLHHQARRHENIKFQIKLTTFVRREPAPNDWT